MMALTGLTMSLVYTVMGMKGLWLHIEGKATMTKPYVELNRIPILSDGKTHLMEEQIKTKETCIVEFDKHECLAQHVLLSTTSICIGSMIKNLKTVKEMCEQIKKDATTKSTLFLITQKISLALCTLLNRTITKHTLVISNNILNSWWSVMTT